MTSDIAKRRTFVFNSMIIWQMIERNSTHVKKEYIFGFYVYKFRMSNGTLRVGYTSVHTHYTVRHVNGF